MSLQRVLQSVYMGYILFTPFLEGELGTKIGPKQVYSRTLGKWVRHRARVMLKVPHSKPQRSSSAATRCSKPWVPYLPLPLHTVALVTKTNRYTHPNFERLLFFFDTIECVDPQLFLHVPI